MEPVGVIDPRVFESVREFPGEELAKMLFPNAEWHGKRLMCSPFRADSDPSFSFFRGRNGISRWKDHGTDESGDNIDLYLRAFPCYSYVEAVDRLGWLVLGHSAMTERSTDRPDFQPYRRVAGGASASDPAQGSALRILEDRPLSASGSPAGLVSYWRDRAVPDCICERLGRCIHFENTNLSKKKCVGGLEVFDSAGRNIMVHPDSEAIGMYNDIGGVNLRVPPSKTHKGFKGGTSCFITTILDDMSRPAQCVRFMGGGDGRVIFFRPSVDGRLFINPYQWFEGMDAQALNLAGPFLCEWDGKFLTQFDTSRICAVLSSLCCPVHQSAIVVEGMFDAFSKFGFQVYGNSSFAGDLVSLNSVSNIRWAVPFLSRHANVFLLLDNDLKSHAGQNASDELKRMVSGYSLACGTSCNIVSCSNEVLLGCKDLNECLVKLYGDPRKVMDFGTQPKVSPEARTNKDKHVLHNSI